MILPAHQLRRTDIFILFTISVAACRFNLVSYPATLSSSVDSMPPSSMTPRSAPSGVDGARSSANATVLPDSPFTASITGMAERFPAANRLLQGLVANSQGLKYDRS